MRTLRMLTIVILTAMALACADPLPEGQRAFVGLWKSDRTTMVITADGRISYEKKEGATTTSYELPIIEITPDHIITGFAFIGATFDIEGPPASRNGYLALVVDGEVLRKVDPENPNGFVTAMPTLEELERLVRKDTSTLLRCIASDDFREYHAGLAMVAQSRFSVEDVAESYRSMAEWDFDIAEAMEGLFQLEAEPRFDEDGILRVEAAFLSKRGDALFANPSFVLTQQGWRSFGTSIGTGTWE